MPGRRTVVRASHIVAYQNGGHRSLRDGVVVVEGNTIVQVGRTFEGEADEIVDATNKIVTPGLISCHAHLAGSPLDKSFIEDVGPRNFYLSGLFEMLPARAAAQDEEATQACIDFSMAEILKTGCTTVCELGGFGDYAVQRAGESGLRMYVGPGFRSGRWFTDDGRTVKYEWDEAAGEEGLRRAVAFVEKHQGAYGDRIRGIISPAQVDTCTPALLKQAKAASDHLGIPLTLHASQSVNEFQEMTRRHGLTPIEWLNEIGFLGPRTILGHAIIVGGSSWANYAADDVRILADTGTSVAHAVWVFARRGIAMESFGKYLRAGVNVALGTDTCPQSMIEALKFAAVVTKIVDRNTELTGAADGFNAATLGGARALGRDDLGRIAPGAKADLVIWDAETLSMAPVRDPIKNLVYNAQAGDVDTVMVDGRIVVRGGEIPGVDVKHLARRLQAAGERMWDRIGSVDRIGRSADALSPQLYPAFREKGGT
ncbi:MAG: amidohydrolase family protein [Chloroflexi bacterium]|nr:amidohydrolase family protein [Chloroflexota bacterium]